MKRKVWLSMVLCMIALLFAGCGKEAPAQSTNPTTTTTLMIYMVGSDLEPKAGAASADLDEIANSGIDLSRNKVVVCAGGAPRWYTEQIDQEQINILTLQEQGFSTVHTTESASMGTAEQLCTFLNYCYEKYPSDEYALILWDHGNGPVMGYGKDILYGNDALQLSEIAQALESSAFSKENKLAWVGFDACLMASAELSCVLSDYANFVVASQEIEPAFGWDYGFLSQLGFVDTLQFLKHIADSYMAACDAYYQDRGYDHYDVTLSIVDLSYAAELENAINSLFATASTEVSHYYDLLAMNRVQSRALGRATTGSEYDLVDLKDMAVKLSTQYPEQTEKLIEVIDRMVVVNAASIEGCCGMSLYYPFYNKGYYEKNWRTIYTQLNAFPEYCAYLEGYEKTWLEENKLENMTHSVMPEETAKNTYSVTLSEEQAQSFGSAVYYVLQRESGDIYRKVFSSQDVVWENNTLTAKYDGMAIYVRENGKDAFIPPLTAVDQINRLYRYSGIFTLSNMTFQPEDVPDEDLPEGIANNWRYLLTLNSDTGKVEMSGTVPLDENSAQDLLEFGRIAEADLSLYGDITFYNAPRRYITRYENGIIKPLDQWYDTDVATGHIVVMANGYSFEYAPLAGGEYYLMFEITDTQSGVYCTELLAITVEDTQTQEENLPITSSKWEQGEERVLLKSQDGIQLYLTVKDTERNGTRYFVEAENANDYAVQIMLTDGIVNGNLLTETGFWSMKVLPYDFMYEEISFGPAEGMGELEYVESLCWNVYVEKERSGATVWQKQQLLVDMTEAPGIDILAQYQHLIEYDAPYMEARGEKQVIYESEDVRLTLMGVGDVSQTSNHEGVLWVCAENLTKSNLNVNIPNVVINGYLIETNNNEKAIPAGKRVYLRVEMDREQLQRLGFDRIHSLTLLAAASERELWWTNQTECLWCPVKLSQSGAQQTIKLGKLLWEENDIRISMYQENPGKGEWLVVVENNSDQDISLMPVDAYFDGVPADRNYTIWMTEEKVGAGQSCIGELYIFDWVGGQPMPKEVKFRMLVRTFDESQVLFAAAESIVLSTQ